MVLLSPVELAGGICDGGVWVPLLKGRVTFETEEAMDLIQAAAAPVEFQLKLISESQVESKSTQR